MTPVSGTPSPEAPPPRAPSRPAGGRLETFRYPAYSIYWASQLVSNMGSWLQSVAASVYVYQLTGSVLDVGILNTIGFVPTLLFSVPGGTLADRFDRRHVVVVSSLLSFVAAVLLAFLTFAGMATVPVVIAVFFVLNTLYALSKPATVSLVPALVPREHIAEAVGWQSLAFILGQIGGPVLATLILASYGAGWAFGLNGLTFLALIVSMAYLYRAGLAGPGTGRAGARGAGRGEGAVQYAGEHPWVWALLVAIIACTVPFEVVRTLAPALVSEGLGESETVAGVIMAAHSTGAAIGLGIVVPTLRRQGRARTMAMTALVLQAVGLVAGAFAPTLAVASVAMGIVGVGFSLSFPVITGMLQEELPDRVRGRVLALHQMAHLGNRPFAAFGIGVLAVAVGSQLALLGGAVLAPIGLVALRVAWRGLDRDTDRSPSEEPVAATS